MSKENFFKQNAERLVFLTLAVLVLVIYYQTVGFSFINFDDNFYVYDNPIVMSGINSESVKWAFTAFYSANWHPLTWLSHITDVQFFGANAGGHHATNIILHLVNSILAFVVFRKMTGDFWKSAIVAALFAVHPVHVESVAWVSERKDVLSTLFWLLTMWAYFCFAKVPSSKSQVPSEADSGENVETLSSVFKNKFYLLTILLFALGLMAKPMLVTLPFVLLLCDYWALERLKSLKDLPKLLLEKVPLFVLSAVSSYITILAQSASGAVETLDFLPFGTRILNAIYAFAAYIGMLFYPHNLALAYPYDRDISFSAVIIPMIILLAITALCLWQIKKRKYLLMGWLWFLGTLVPVIGIVQVGTQSMADRYTYIPYFGLFIMLVWGIWEIFQKFKISQTVYLAVFGIAILIFTFLAFKQTALWRDHETLYKRTLAVTQGNVLIAQNLCHYLLTENRLDEAEGFCRQAIEMRPGFYETYNTLGIVMMKRENYAEAEKLFRQTLQILPNYPVAYANLATALSLQGKPEEAEENLEKAVNMSFREVKPQVWAEAARNLATAYASQGKYEKALENFKRAVYFAPDRADYRADLALANSSLKSYDEAQKQIEMSLQMNPNDARSYNIYGKILLAQDRKSEAVGLFEKALQLKPDFAEAKENLKQAKGEK